MAKDDLLFDIQLSAPRDEAYDDPIENVEVPEPCDTCAFQDECYPIYEPDGTCWEEL